METKPLALTIHELLSHGEYVIPLYQRNYAWSTAEITQLLEDIWDKADEASGGQYYIGTFVTDLRDDGRFELVDGQQRHTTLTLIHAILMEGYADINPNLFFDARKNVEELIASLFTGLAPAKKTASKDVAVNGILTAINVIENFLHYCKDKEKFSNYFYNNVVAIRVQVPPGTDINHYFEVMNNRGEQLEKHEVLKAAFMAQLKGTGKEDTFGLLWEACSQMDSHVQSHFSLDTAKGIFGSALDEIPRHIMQREIPLATVTENGGMIEEILALSADKKFKQGRLEQTVNRFTSVIDFPGFLLIVLCLHGRRVTLDDKKLLRSFGYNKGQEGYALPDATAFMNDLFYYRVLFDRYIIKREEAGDDWSWDLSRATRKDGELYYVNTFSQSDNVDRDETTKHIATLQSMLHVSFPANNYKDWLLQIMQAIKSNDNINAAGLRDELWSIAKNECTAISTGQFSAGTNTKRFLFNLLDFILWNGYDKNKLSKTGKQAFARFKFTVNNSVEHMQPQSCIDEIKTDVPENSRQLSKQDILNDFGNLCLISRGANSKYNNFNFEAKKQQFLEHPATESLKQVLMFEYKGWNTPEILEHGAAMKKYLRDLIPGADDSL